MNEGDIVDLIGKVREYNEERYIAPEAVNVIDVETELMRRLEQKKLRQQWKKKQEAVAELMNQVADMEELKRFAFERLGLEEEETEAILMTMGNKKEEMDNDREMLLKLIDELDLGEGASYSDLLEKSGLGEAKLDQLIGQLLEDGLCFEPRPGKIKRL